MMEEQLSKMRDEMKTKSLTGSAGSGLVTVTINGEKELQSIQIKPECVDPNDLEGLQDLIRAACQDAYKKVESDNPMGNMGGFSLPFGL